MKRNQGPKVLLLDIETAPIIAHVWKLFDQNVALNQIVKDWHLLSWSAKWLESKDKKTVYGPHRKIMYKDQRNIKNIENDKILSESIWKLINEADVIITQNGKKFDLPKLNARFIHHEIKPPSSYKQIDTFQIAKRHFELTSNKLEYMTDKFCKKYKKLKHKEFPGHELWNECLKGNKKAWKEMERYNKHDVLALEELYHVFAAWDNSINFNLYRDDLQNVCKCGGTEFTKNGHSYTSVGKFQRYECKKCGHEVKDRTNLFSKEKRKALKVGTTR